MILYNIYIYSSFSIHTHIHIEEDAFHLDIGFPWLGIQRNTVGTSFNNTFTHDKALLIYCPHMIIRTAVKMLGQV